MTKPGEPKIRINPSAEEKKRLSEWLDIGERQINGQKVLTIWHRTHARIDFGEESVEIGQLDLPIRDHCTFQDWFAQHYWEEEEDKTPDEQRADSEAGREPEP